MGVLYLVAWTSLCLLVFLETGNRITFWTKVVAIDGGDSRYTLLLCRYCSVAPGSSLSCNTLILRLAHTSLHLCSSLCASCSVRSRHIAGGGVSSWSTSHGPAQPPAPRDLILPLFLFCPIPLASLEALYSLQTLAFAKLSKRGCTHGCPFLRILRVTAGN